MTAPISLSELATALQVERGELISLVGGGGKTTTLFALGDQLVGTTVLTTTTKMGAEQSGEFDVLIDPTDQQLRSALEQSGRVLAWKAADDRRAIGVDALTADRWFGIADNVVVEADGSRKRPFKAPAGHEPVIPSTTTLLIACVGASAFGRVISECCHRPDQVAALAGCSESDILTPARAAGVLQSSQGSRKDLPPGARFAIAVCRVGEQHGAAIDDLAKAITDDTLIVAVADGLS